MAPKNPRPNPYIGPRAFKIGEKMYGRDHEIRQLLDLLIAERIVLLHAPSGAGKSSLVQAGLIPQLQKKDFIVYPIIRINLEPPEKIKQIKGFNRYAYSAMASLEESLPKERRTPPKELAGLTLQAYLQRLREIMSNGGSNPKGEGHSGVGFTSEILILDQFEEIITIDPINRQPKMEFFKQLGELLRDRDLWALFSMREDYMASLDPYLRFIPTRLGNTFRLDLLGQKAALQAIQGPTRDLEKPVEFDDKTAQDLVDDLRNVQVQLPDGSMEKQLGPYVEPLQLQVVCFRLWESLEPEDTCIDANDLKAIGDVDQSLSEYYGQRVEDIALSSGVSERVIREWFDRRLITESGFRNQVLMEQDSSAGLENNVINLLENTHLIRAEKRAGALWYELSHDRLIQPVRQNNNTWFESHLSLLQRQAGLWDSQSRPEGLLFTGRELADAVAWAAENREKMTDSEKEFLEACQRQEQRIQQRRRMNRRIRMLAVAATILAVFALGASLFAFSSRNQALVAERTALAASTSAVREKLAAETASAQEAIQRMAAQTQEYRANAASTEAVAQANAAATAQAVAEVNAKLAQEQKEEAQKQARIALARQLTSQALSFLNFQPDLASLLAIEAHRLTEQSWEARNILLTVLERSQTFDQNNLFQLQQRIRQADDVNSVAINEDNSLLAWGKRDKYVTVWDVPANQERWNRLAHNAPVTSVVFSQDGKIMASAGEDSQIFIWDVESGEFIRLRDVINVVNTLTFSPDGKRIAAGVGTQIDIWEVEQNQKGRPLRAERGDFVYSLAWSLDGEWIVSGAGLGRERKPVRIWNAENGNQIAAFTGPQNSVFGVALSSDKKLLAAGSADGNVYLWNFGADQSQATQGQLQGNKPFVDLEETEVKLLQGHTGEVLSLAFSSDGRFLASGSSDRTVIVWDTQTLKPILTLDPYSSSVRSLAFSPQKGDIFLATGSFDNFVYLYKAQNQNPLGKDVDSLQGSEEILSILRAEDAVYLARNGKNKVFLETSNSDGIQSTEIDFRGAVSAAIHPQEDVLALGDIEGRIQLFDTQSGEALFELPWVPGELYSLTFSSDGNTLASGQCSEAIQIVEQRSCPGGIINLWDLSGGSAGQPRQFTMSGSTALPRSLAFHPDGSLLAYGLEENTVRLLNLDSGASFGLPLRKHTEAVTSLAFSPDGSTLASGSDDHTVVLWDVNSRQPLGESFTGPTASVHSLAFSPDGKTLYSGYSNGRLMEWVVDMGAWIDRICELVGRNLSRDEWSQFLPDQEYQETCP